MTLFVLVTVGLSLSLINGVMQWRRRWAAALGLRLVSNCVVMVGWIAFPPYRFCQLVAAPFAVFIGLDVRLLIRGRALKRKHAQLLAREERLRQQLQDAQNRCSAWEAMRLDRWDRGRPVELPSEFVYWDESGDGAELPPERS